MPTDRLNTPKDYFEQVVVPNYDAFMNTRSSFQTSLNMALSLFHLRDWVFKLEKAKVERVLGMTFKTEAALWKQVETRVPEAKYIRDLANASKHVTLTHLPSTGMTHIANTSIVSNGYGVGNFGQGRYSAPSVLMDDKHGTISLDDCATKLLSFWRDLLGKF